MIAGTLPTKWQELPYFSLIYHYHMINSWNEEVPQWLDSETLYHWKWISIDFRKLGEFGGSPMYPKTPLYISHCFVWDHLSTDFIIRLAPLCTPPKQQQLLHASCGLCECCLLILKTYYALHLYDGTLRPCRSFYMCKNVSCHYTKACILFLQVKAMY